MNLADFAAITGRIINDQGIDDFLPTLCLPGRRELRALDSAPEDENLEAAVLDWAASIAEPNEEFLIAFKLSRSEVKVIRRSASADESEIFSV
jgi:hypothetical protein